MTTSGTTVELDDLVCAVAAHRRQWCLLLNYAQADDHDERAKEIERDAPWADVHARVQLHAEGWAAVFFESKADCLAAFEQTRGPDSGGMVYAAIFDAAGEYMRDNE